MTHVFYDDLGVSSTVPIYDGYGDRSFYYSHSARSFVATASNRVLAHMADLGSGSFEEFTAKVAASAKALLSHSPEKDHVLLAIRKTNPVPSFGYVLFEDVEEYALKDNFCVDTVNG